MFRPNLTLSEAGGALLLWMAMLLLPLAPLSTRYSAGMVFLFVFATLVSRNIAVIAGFVFGLNLATRFAFPVSSWHDQHWVQWSSISAVLTGHNIFDTSPLSGTSLSNYMPMGDLFGGVFIALGIQQYWQVWHVIAVCLFVLPCLFSPSFATLLIFIGCTCCYGFNDYTTGGGTLEIGVATTIAAIAMYRAGLIIPSLIIFAFASQFRQPAVMLIPFVLLLLWRERNLQGIAIFLAALFLFGGVFMLLNLSAAYEYLFRIWDKYHQELFNYVPGLNANYSVSSLPHIFGIDDSVPWTQWKPIYMPLTLLSVGALFFIACRSKSSDTILGLALWATLFVYLFSRGYSQFHYVLSACFPFAALLYPGRPASAAFPKYSAKALAFVILWIGTIPVALFAASSIATLFDNPGALSPIPIAHTFEIPQAGSPVPIPNLDGADANRHTFPLGSSLQITFNAPADVSAIRLSGDHIGMMTIKGVPMRYATETEMRGIVTDGSFDYSGPNTIFRPLMHFRNSVNYSMYSAVISLPRTAGLVSSLRLTPRALYLDQREWILGKVEVFARR